MNIYQGRVYICSNTALVAHWAVVVTQSSANFDCSNTSQKARQDRHCRHDRHLWHLFWPSQSWKQSVRHNRHTRQGRQCAQHSCPWPDNNKSKSPALLALPALNIHQKVYQKVYWVIHELKPAVWYYQVVKSNEFSPRYMWARPNRNFGIIEYVWGPAGPAAPAAAMLHVATVVPDYRADSPLLQLRLHRTDRFHAGILRLSTCEIKN